MYIRWLENASHEDFAEVGGKGANLGEMLRLGLPVPQGFCITAAAYRAAVSSCNLREKLNESVQRRDWAACAAEAKAYFSGLALPEELLSVLVLSYRSLGEGAVAVRSSATAEDLADATFAGQQETYLNIEEENEFLAAVRKCWASLWSERALHYRDTRNVAHFATDLCVVVQRMVPAEVAGVLFTVDPVSEDRGRMLIEAASGLGEALVSGQTAGDVFKLDRRGANLILVADEFSQPPVLAEATILELGRMGLLLEEHFGCPQDIEFAVTEEGIWLLQARPITTLSEEEVFLPPELKLRPIQKLVMSKVIERFPLAPKPLDIVTAEIFIGGSMYVFDQFGFSFPVRSRADELEAWAHAFRIPNPKPTFRLIGLPPRLANLLRRDWKVWWDEERRERLEKECAPAPLESLTAGELLSRFQTISLVWGETMKERAYGTFVMNIVEQLLKIHLVLALGPRKVEEALADLLQDLGTRTTEVNQALWDLAAAAQAHPNDGEYLQESMAGFLQKYGHREGVTWYLSTPVWRNDPRPVHSLLRGLARLDGYPFASRSDRQRRTRERIGKRLRFLPGFRSSFNRLADLYRNLQIFEENSHFDLTRPLAALQEISIQCGERLCAQGWLQRPEDVFYLFREEMFDWLSGNVPPLADARKLIERRKLTYRRLNNRWQSKLALADKGGPSSTLTGKAASTGVVRGKARIIGSEMDFHLLEPGEILVCPYTNPSWTPLFASAAAVVTETGNAVSHAAIVAREYGIPAVMGVPGATKQIVNGQEIVVDGGKGTVILGQRTAYDLASERTVGL
ncbi:hypothetical protein LMZ02_08175 [Paenibacillus macerans]|nr:PEP/pyruvate-binding domain-containing protein [Paenibacillus macerans]UMV49312.1 hypothetical protein LMZ02_08175 [Paenibacillus macerans]